MSTCFSETVKVAQGTLRFLQATDDLGILGTKMTWKSFMLVTQQVGKVPVVTCMH